MQDDLACKTLTNGSQCLLSLNSLANRDDPDAAFHQGFHCLLRLKNLQEQNDIRHNLENSTCDPSKYTMASPILIISIFMGKSIQRQRINSLVQSFFSAYG